MKIQIRIALLFTLVCSAIIIVLSLAVLYFAHERAFEDFYTRLELRATLSAKANLDAGDVGAYKEVRMIHLARLPNEKEYIISIDSLNNRSPAALGLQVPAAFLENIIRNKSASYRDGFYFVRGIYYTNQKGQYAVIVSAEHMFARNFLTSLKTILITANLIAMMVVFSVGLIFSKQILAPIRKLTQQVKKISVTSLHKRLAVKQGKDEISELAVTFNNMINRLETSFDTQNNFVSNASHELNTPLTAIMGEAEFALKKERTPLEYQQSFTTILKQAEKLKNITASLLELAQSGFTGNLSFEHLNVQELVTNVYKVAGSIYPECNLVLDYSLVPANFSEMSIQGNFHLLELCLCNITLNACKYANNGMVTFAVAASDKYLIFIIKDEGIGIPEHDMPHIFDPFFRASNVKSSKGYGIGLPLSYNIIKLHKGVIDVASKEAEGTEVVIKIPKRL